MVNLFDLLARLLELNSYLVAGYLVHSSATNQPADKDPWDVRRDAGPGRQVDFVGGGEHHIESDLISVDFI